MANLLERELHYPFGDTVPLAGQVIDVAPGANPCVKWLRMGLPFALDHINLWLLDDGDGWTIVDCGITNDATKAAWEQVFAGALDGKPVVRVIATHMHPDHIGLAHWLTERWQCRLWISATDYNGARLASQSTDRIRRRALGGLLCQPRPDRSRGPGQGPRARRTTTPAWCRTCPRRTAGCSTA